MSGEGTRGSRVRRDTHATRAQLGSDHHSESLLSHWRVRVRPGTVRTEDFEDRRERVLKRIRVKRVNAGKLNMQNVLQGWTSVASYHGETILQKFDLFKGDDLDTEPEPEPEPEQVVPTSWGEGGGEDEDEEEGVLRPFRPQSDSPVGDET